MNLETNDQISGNLLKKPCARKKNVEETEHGIVYRETIRQDR